MSAPLNITLANSSFYIDSGKTTEGSIRIQIRNEMPEDVTCKMVKINIPYGPNSTALTSSNAFEIGNTDYWSEPSGPFPTENGHVSLSLINDFDTIESGITDSFHLYKIPMNPNGESEGEREVNIVVECYASEEDIEAFYSVPLNFVLKTQDPDNPQPFVNYFSASTSNVRPEEEITLSWEIAHGKEMILYPVFLSDHDQVQERSTQMRSDEDPQPLLIDRETPIKLSRSAGSLKVKLERSTQFVLKADSEGNKGSSQLVVYLKELTVVSFKAKDHDTREPYEYLKPLTLEWIITFSDKDATDNQAFLLINEFGNDGKALPKDAKSPAPPGRFHATRVIPINPRKPAGSLTVYPARPTEYMIYISEENPFSTKSESLKINMETIPYCPIGTITMLPGSEIPTGWRICDGTVIRKTEIPEHAFNELALVLGQSNKAETLRLPNLRDRFPVAAGSRNSVNRAGGPDPVEHAHYIDPENVRASTSYNGKHHHTTNPYRTRRTYDSGSHWAVGDIHESPTSEVGNHRHSVNINIPRTPSTGMSFSRNPSTHKKYKALSKLNRPHFYALNFIIRVK